MSILEKFKSKKEKELKGEVVEVTAKEEKAEKEPKEKKAKKTLKAVPADLSGTIVRPLVTEKAAVIAHAGQYSFVVAPDANRIAVSKAIKAMYGIQPESVNIQRVRGKVVRFGRSVGQRAAWKKAIVTLPKGKTIDVYEGV
ncbi:50S ribosomal protein L23 [bacterium]|nr:50S ribosomal protein L23 [bacterium]